MESPHDHAPGGGVQVPPTRAGLAWLREVGDPVVALRLAIDLDRREESVVDGLRLRVLAQPAIVDVFLRQKPDGSWGSHDDPVRRILPTLRVVQTLAEQGATCGQWHLGAEFLAATAHIGDGVFSTDGAHDGVLSCYVGMAATAYLLGGRDDLAEPQLDWIRRHQAVQRRGHSFRPDSPELWGSYLEHRYGGCMANTTCLVGLAKAGRALQLHRDLHNEGSDDPLIASIREALLERRIIAATDGSVVAIASPKSDPRRWLAPTFPLDWHTDLIEVVDFVARAGPADQRMQPALDIIADVQLDDGTWPRRRAFWPDDFTIRARCSRTRPDPVATLRAVLAIDAIQPNPPIL